MSGWHSCAKWLHLLLTPGYNLGVRSLLRSMFCFVEVLVVVMLLLKFYSSFLGKVLPIAVFGFELTDIAPGAGRLQRIFHGMESKIFKFHQCFFHYVFFTRFCFAFQRERRMIYHCLRTLTLPRSLQKSPLATVIPVFHLGSSLVFVKKSLLSV